MSIDAPKDEIMRFKRIFKITLVTLLILFTAVFTFGYWFVGLIQVDIDKHMSGTGRDILPTELPYLAKDSIPNRGKLLAVVTSTAQMGVSEKSTGYELTELSRAYYVFTANGFDVDVASPRGGEPPVVIDDDDVDVYDFAFMNDPAAQYKVSHTIKLADVHGEDYSGIYFVGGKGAMYDFPDNPSIQALVRSYHEENKVIGAVCHGPAALVNVTLSDGSSLLSNKRVSSFTNEEELFLIPNASEIFPFLLQDKLAEQGAVFEKGTMYLENVVLDGNIVTGQNPWSTWALAESMITKLGYTPKPRGITAEENSVQILNTYEKEGDEAARIMIDRFLSEGIPIQRELIAVHCFLSVMQRRLGRAIDLIGLLKYVKNME